MSPLYDADGNEVEVYVTSSSGWTIDRDGNVRHYHEDQDGREEWTEHISESPLRGCLPEWIWDLTLDPRGPGDDHFKGKENG